MRVLVTGGSGLVGWSLVDHISNTHDVSFTYFGNQVEHPAADGYGLDIRDVDEVTDLVSDLRPDVVVHAAAMTDVDACERKPTRARRVNIAGTEHVVSACESIGAAVVFLSTSFVFSGAKSQYATDDDRDPVNEYGRTKVAAEARVQDAGIQSVIVRTDQPYGWSKPWQIDTMVEWVLESLTDSDTLTVFEDWFNMPTHVPDLVRAVTASLSVQSDAVYHAVGPDYRNRYEWARQITSAFGVDPDRIERTKSADADLPATRPAVRLDTERTYNELGVEPATIEEGLERMLATPNR